MTEDLLDVTRLQAGRLVLSRKPTDLVALIQHMMEQAQISTDRHTLSLQTSLPSLPVEIAGAHRAGTQQSVKQCSQVQSTGRAD